MYLTHRLSWKLSRTSTDTTNAAHQPNSINQDAQPTHLAARNPLVLRRVVLIRKSGQHGASLVEVKPQEERHTETIAGGAIIHPVHCRLQAAIRHPHEGVADVDDERTGDRLRLDPLAARVEDLQATYLILPQECQALEIGVCTQTDIDWAVRLSEFGG